MKSINNNPYRIIGILAGATEKELQQRKSKIQAYARINKPIDSELDFSFLPFVERTPAVIEQAFSSIEQAQDRLNHALFWFVNTTPMDAMAIDYLKKGDIQKAEEIWVRITEGKEITPKNFSAFANLGTLYLRNENDQRALQKAMALKTKLIESESFVHFVHLVADQTLSVDRQRQLNNLITQWGTIPAQSLVALFAGCSDAIRQQVGKKASQEPIHKIETLLEKVEKKRREDPEAAYKAGKHLYTNAKDVLIQLKYTLGATDLNYKRLSDALAKELIQCSVDYINKLQDEVDDEQKLFNEGMELLQWAKSLAINNLTKERAQENIKTLERMKERELNRAINLLESVKEHYIEARNTLLRRQGLASLVSSSEDSPANVIVDQSINWEGISSMIRNEMVTPQMVLKIKNSKNTELLDEYKKLVNFLFKHLPSGLQCRMEYLRYWQTTSSTQRNTSSSTTTAQRTTSSSSTAQRSTVSNTTAQRSTSSTTTQRTTSSTTSSEKSTPPQKSTSSTTEEKTDYSLWIYIGVIGIIGLLSYVFDFWEILIKIFFGGGAMIGMLIFFGIIILGLIGHIIKLFEK